MWRAVENPFDHLAESRAKELLEHQIYLHRKKSEPAFLSGQITAYRRENYRNPKNGISKLRTVFDFATHVGKSVTTGPEGWTQSGIKFIP